MGEPRYRISVHRRNERDNGYENEPWTAHAVRVSDNALLAVQFGGHAGIAFAKALRYVDEDRQREPVEVVLSDG